MTIMIQLPNPVEDSLRQAARRQRLTPEAYAAQLIEDALTTAELPGIKEGPTPEVLTTLEELVASIQSLPRDPNNIRPATGSLQELLENAPEDPEFDLDEWQRQWDLFEQELKEIERADRERDGLGY